MSIVYSFQNFQKNELDTKSTWTTSKIDDIILHDKIAMNPSFSRAFNPNFNLTWPFIIDNRRRLQKGDDHITLEISGLQGGGKSRLAQAIAKYWWPIEDIHIVFNIEECLKIASNLQPGKLIIVDDQRELGGLGSEREKLELKALIETVRLFGLSIFLLSPTPKNIDTSIHYRLEVIQKNEVLRMTKAAIRKGKTYAGYITIPIEEDETDILWQKYIPVKDAFVKQDAIKRDVNIRVDYKDLAVKVKKHPKWHPYIDGPALAYLITEQNPRLTVAERDMIFQSYRIYIGIQRLEKEYKKGYQAKPRYNFTCKLCSKDFDSLKEKGPLKCPYCMRAGWK